ncbi:RIP metalloprotease RseP [Candidatus Azambacteria bacterium RIFOXYD1_FULL_42_11]|uniref:Zinc metalloprotease n=4 Tax=Candidatus Azamiibacteriota TaxID=1752741 RepID=A0A0G1BJW1_9BACT|nr:MAG: Membrane-associated zinc metalloprotease [Candidatus Azambacteria bacterium GW2011_GWB1_42_17]KKS46581.1 MAG: Membrane-associated zinc metalloprotease [Candidatus Azambacteria bacterium GW2011_GWA1_42_19]KKS75544.1 MAG: Membrane-associated zinc metalloprotease [Candidatus Azambacteria bacterium GW2011_GWA2_42_9]KKS88887.1 MAG: Membrane-associated zinc metalloprotease [Parcubacteria group bacterium GW2011_GWC1_43_11]OGD43139.1 MAG: RIP metalloprotease RseP [Candidatus Azambacteria bacter
MTLIIFIIVLAILVLAHEWGHFMAAKKSGLTVEEFGFGFPPKIFSFKKGETTYSVNLLPLGGFVKILGEDGNNTDNPKSFSSKSAGIRGLITVSGVAMNFILAVFLLIVGFNIGLPQIIDENNKALAKNINIQIVAIVPNSPAEIAGIKLGDSIKNFSAKGGSAFGGDEIIDFQNFVNSHKGKEIALKIQRGKDNLEIKAIPRINPPEGEGALGIALAKTGTVSYPWYQSVWLGLKSSLIITWEIIKGFFNLIKNILIAGKIPQEISGPVGIAVLTGQAANLGFIYLLQLVALISLNLTVLNLLPFPALDGGRLLFLAIEKIKGSKVNPKIENAIHGLGLALLLALAILITYRDILRLR